MNQCILLRGSRNSGKSSTAISLSLGLLIEDISSNVLYVDTEMVVKFPEIKSCFPKEIREIPDKKFHEILEKVAIKNRLNFVNTKDINELTLFLSHFIGMIKLKKGILDAS